MHRPYSALRCCLVLGLLLLTQSSLSATVLTFDIDPISDGLDVPQTYGDNVTDSTMGSFHYGGAGELTPNITVSYGNVTPSLWTSGYGDLNNALYEDEDDGVS